MNSVKDKVVRVPTDLKPRLLEVLKLVQRGYSNKLIAEELKRSETAISERVTRIGKLLGGMNRVEMAVWYTKYELQNQNSILLARS